MLDRIHQRLGTAGFVIAIVALVAALGGGAYAATAGLSGKQKKEVEKIAKKFAGKPGAAGPAGPAGAAGAAGSTGTNGTNGSAGSPGAAGKEGKEGSPWTAGGTLPSGSTETGVWTYGPLAAGVEKARVPISFPVPLEAGVVVKYLTDGAPSTAECPGTREEPEASPGFLCVYEAAAFGNTFSLEQNPEGGAEEGTGTTGVILVFENEEEGGFANGDWALTAP